jgi:hypothetical protein
MRPDEEEKLRDKIAEVLASGLKTQTEPFPETHIEFAHLKNKLVIAGFTDKPYGPDQMRCLECMYYLVHRKWCDLPELAVPVEPDWWCRLWRI